MLNKEHADLLKHLVRAKVGLGRRPYQDVEPLEGFNKWCDHIGKSTINNVERFSDFMEYSNLLNNTLRNRISTDLLMEYFYKNPKGIETDRMEASIWADETTEIIIDCIGLTMRLYSKLVE